MSFEPNKIYLHDPDGYFSEEYSAIDNTVVWSEDRISDDDYEYILSSHAVLADVRAIAEEMINPIKYLTDEAKKQGGVLNGSIAIQISNDVEFYKIRAKRILQKVSEHFS